MKSYILKTQTTKKFTIDYKNELNNEQYEVVTRAQGPSLVLAGAGTGKTRTLVYRVAYLIEQGVSPKNILLVTFTNKAAREMLERVETLIEYPPKGLWGGTFHHIANRILHIYGQRIGIKKNFTIIDEDDARRLLKHISQEYGLSKSYFPKPAVLKSIVSYCTNSGIPIDEYIQSRYKNFGSDIVPAIIKISQMYQKRKLQSGNLDFDDLLVYWQKLLEEDQNSFELLRHQFQYILVDEYQDTNRLQAKIINLLASFHKNILVVGDDAQSIYSFRAAEISNILDFPQQYNNTKIFHLRKNYRSRPEILEFANHSINQNQYQFKKDLHAHREKSGQRPIYVTLKDAKEQAQFVSQRILELAKENVNLSDVAVLLRAAFQALELELELNRRNIPYIMRGGLRFFEQAHIKDVVAFLKIYTNPKDELSWRRVMMMQDGVGPKSVEKFVENIKPIKTVDELWSQPQVIRSLSGRSHIGFQNVLHVLQRLQQKQDEGLEAMMSALLEDGYRSYVEKTYEKSDDRIEDIMQMARFAGQKSIEEFLSEVMLSEGFKGEIHRETHANTDSLVLSTIHQAKGLEWNTVFLIGLCEGQFPHHKVLENPHEIEEERRLFYVASTRAKECLYLTNFTFQFSAQTGQYIQRPSQFIEELPDELFENWKVENEEAEELIVEEGILERVSRVRHNKKKRGALEYLYE